MELSRRAWGLSFGLAPWVFVGVFFIRLIVLARLTASPLLLPAQGDMHFYDEWARQILQGRLTDHLAFYGLPLYAYLLAAIYKLVGYGPFIPGLLQACLDAGTAVLLCKLGGLIFATDNQFSKTQAEDSTTTFPLSHRGKVVGLMAALGWAFFAPAQAYAVILMPTVWFIFIFWFVVWRVVKADSQMSARESLLLGLLIGISAMGIATILFLVPLVLTAVFFKWPINTSKRALSIAISAILFISGVALGTSPCWIHNYFVARDPVFLSAHSGVNFWIGNNPMATGYPRFPPGLHAGQEAMLKDSINAAEMAAGRPLKRSEVSAYWSSKANDYIRHHFVDWLRLLMTKTRNFWNAFQYDDLSIITALRENHVIFPALRFGFVAALAIPGLLVGLRRFPLSRWITAAILLQMLAILPVFITERYRLAVVPGLLLFAAFGLSIFWQACVAKQFRVVGLYLSLLICSTILVGWPQRDASLWALDSYNSGWRALESNDFATAERKLNLAYAYVPDNAETNFALGNLNFALSKKAEAKVFYRATLQLDPNHEGAYNNLGILALEEERWTVATKFFAKALEQDPCNAKTYFLLAEAHFRGGDVGSARDEIDEAITLKPDQPEFRDLRRRIETGSH
ncbi:MAG: tetratricopeptide repeat protein [Verrucomicrobiota bacterium]